MMQEMKKIGYPLIIGFLLVVVSTISNADGGAVVTGKIAQIDVAASGNLPFRVRLEGEPILCPGGMAEGYIDDISEKNYKVYVSALMMAKVTGATVSLYSELGTSNRCRIVYMSVK